MTNNNYKGEVVKEYESVEEAILDLKEYIKNDLVYEEYKANGINEDTNNCDIFFINHINSIIKLIEEYKK